MHYKLINAVSFLAFAGTRIFCFQRTITQHNRTDQNTTHGALLITAPFLANEFTPDVCSKHTLAKNMVHKILPVQTSLVTTFPFSFDADIWSRFCSPDGSQQLEVRKLLLGQLQLGSWCHFRLLLGGGSLRYELIMNTVSYSCRGICPFVFI